MSLYRHAAIKAELHDLESAPQLRRTLTGSLSRSTKAINLHKHPGIKSWAQYCVDVQTVQIKAPRVPFKAKAPTSQDIWAET